MANRPLHLRWIYVKNHPMHFVALALVGAAGIVAAAALLEDPYRGLALGAVPAMLLITMWTLTNNAGYADRVPHTLAHERPHIAPDPVVSKGDPFASTPAQVPVSPTKPTPEAATPQPRSQPAAGRTHARSEKDQPAAQAPTASAKTGSKSSTTAKKSGPKPPEAGAPASSPAQQGKAPSPAKKGAVKPATQTQSKKDPVKKRTSSNGEPKETAPPATGNRATKAGTGSTKKSTPATGEAEPTARDSVGSKAQSDPAPAAKRKIKEPNPASKKKAKKPVTRPASASPRPTPKQPPKEAPMAPAEPTPPPSDTPGTKSVAAAPSEAADTKQRRIRFKRGRPEAAPPPQSDGEEADAWDPFSDYRKTPPRPDGPGPDDPQSTPATEPVNNREEVAAKAKAAKPVDGSKPSVAPKAKPAAGAEEKPQVPPAQRAKPSAGPKGNPGVPPAKTAKPAAAQEIEKPLSPAEAAKRSAEEAKRKRRGKDPKKGA